MIVIGVFDITLSYIGDISEKPPEYFTATYNVVSNLFEMALTLTQIFVLPAAHDKNKAVITSVAQPNFSLVNYMLSMARDVMCKKPFSFLC
jgi:hypothetical protein